LLNKFAYGCRLSGIIAWAFSYYCSGVSEGLGPDICEVVEGLLRRFEEGAVEAVTPFPKLLGIKWLAAAAP
jgi:hypothetical protein